MITQSAWLTGLLVILVLPCYAKAARVRVAPLVLSDAGQAAFQCPDECEECGTAHSHKTFIKDFGTSHERFKCILKAGLPATVKPANRECTEAKARNKQYRCDRFHTQSWDYTASELECPRSICKWNGGSPDPFDNRCEASKWSEVPLAAKTECNYTNPEKDSRAWEKLAGTKCSTRSVCCCDAAEDWSETQCFPFIDGVDPMKRGHKFNATSNHFRESLPIATVETYETDDQTFLNENNACQGSSLASHTHQVGAVKKFEEEGQGTVNWAPSGCCLKTVFRNERYQYRSCSGTTCSGPPKARHCRSWTRDCHAQVQVKRCIKFEKLYHCGGVQQNKIQATRISTKTGMCIGDQSTPERLQRTYGYDSKPTFGHDGKPNGKQVVKLKRGMFISGWECPADFTRTVGGRQCTCTNSCTLNPGFLPARLAAPTHMDAHGFGVVSYVS